MAKLNKYKFSTSKNNYSIKAGSYADAEFIAKELAVKHNDKEAVFTDSSGPYFSSYITNGVAKGIISNY